MLHLKRLEVVIQIFPLIRTVLCDVFSHSHLLFSYVTLKFQACKC